MGGYGTCTIDSTALIEVVKSLAPSNVKGHGKVLYQTPQLKSMVHGVYQH